MNELKIKALLIHLGEELTQDNMDMVSNPWGETFEFEGEEYLVLEGDEVEEAVADYIDETLWAFNSGFLSDLTRIDSVVFETLGKLCEGANEAVRSIIDATCGMEEVVSEAIRWDGAGHFLSSYDGSEVEVTVEGETLYLYRN